MKSIDKERALIIESKRKEYAIEQIEKSLGYKLTFESENELRFMFNGSEIKFFPYTGWATGKTIKDGRGLNNLLKQLI